MSHHTLRMGTRGSLLARKQSDWTARHLQSAHANLKIETVVIKTTGDRIADRPLHEVGGKGLFVKELEQALLDGMIDFAVHSYKDVPVTMPVVDQSGLFIAATPPREDPRELLVSKYFQTITQLPADAKVGTGSLRRRCQLLAMRNDLSIQSIRGNIDTRIGKVNSGEFDAIVLAVAGIKRAELLDINSMHIIPAAEMLPAPGQGALAIQCRKGDASTIELIKVINHPPTAICIEAERSIVSAFKGDCYSPIAALAEIENDTLHFRAAIGKTGGELPVIRASAQSPLMWWKRAVDSVLQALLDQGAMALLHPSDNAR